MQTFELPPFLPKVIVMTRHPQSMHNVIAQTALKRGIPNKESPLTEVGEEQRDITAAYLRSRFTFDTVYASEYSRTHAIPLAMSAGHRLQVYSHLNERNMGIWHTIPREIIEVKYPDQVALHATTDYYDLHPLQGESCAMVESRQMEWLSDESVHRGNQCVYVSGHGISGLCFRRLLTGESVGAWHWWRTKESNQRLGFASVTVYERRGPFYICTLYNHMPWENLIDPRRIVKKEREE